MIMMKKGESFFYSAARWLSAHWRQQEMRRKC